MKRTLSKAMLASLCHYSVSDDAEWDVQETEAMRRGTEIHRTLEERISFRTGAFFVDGDSTTALEYAVDALNRHTKRVIADEIAAGRLDAKVTRWASEIAYGLGELGPVCLGVRLGRAYPEGLLWAGTADMVVVIGRRLLVFEWKTGVTPIGEPSHVAQVEALAALAGFVELATVPEYVLVNVDTGDEVSSVFGGVSSKLSELEAIAKAAAASPKPKPGMHCDRCPASATCPATKAALARVESWAITTADDVARIWPQLAPVEDAIEAIRKKIRTFVEASGAVDLPGGKRLRIIESSGRESVSVKDVVDAVGPEKAAELRANGVIKCGAPVKQLRVVKGG